MEVNQNATEINKNLEISDKA